MKITVRSLLKYFFAGLRVVGIVVGIIFLILLGLLLWKGVIEDDIARFSNDRYEFRVYKRAGNWVTSISDFRIDYVDKCSFLELSESVIKAQRRDSAHVQFLPDDQVLIRLFYRIPYSKGTELMPKEEYLLDLNNMPETIKLGY